MAGKKGKSGRKKTADKLTPENIQAAADAAEALAALALTDAQIAEKFNISPSTLQGWKEKFPIFYDSLKRGKADKDDAVELSLYDRACGYSHPEDKIFLGKDGAPVIVPTIKHYPPDPTSMIFWLKNRRRDQWRDKSEIDHGIAKSSEKIVERLTKALERIS